MHSFLIGDEHISTIFVFFVGRMFAFALEGLGGLGFGRGASQVIFVRTRSGLGAGGAVVRFSAGLLLRTFARVECWLNFLSLLARVFSFALGRGMVGGRATRGGRGSVLGCCC